MTKENLQKELLEKVKPGTKPSDIRKLKRSKSADDIPSPLSKGSGTSFPSAPPLPQSTPLSKSSSQPSFADAKYPYTTLMAQQEELVILRAESKTKSTTIALLRKKIDDLEKHPPSPLLEEQLKEKQQQIEELRKQLETKSLGNSELDQALSARHQNLKSWFTQYSKNKILDQELTENIDEASEELLNQDQAISQLRSENRKLKLTNQSLQKDLDLAHRAVA